MSKNVTTDQLLRQAREDMIKAYHLRINSEDGQEDKQQLKERRALLMGALHKTHKVISERAWGIRDATDMEIFAADLIIKSCEKELMMEFSE